METQRGEQLVCNFKASPCQEPGQPLGLLPPKALFCLHLKLPFTILAVASFAWETLLGTQWVATPELLHPLMRNVSRRVSHLVRKTERLCDHSCMDEQLAPQVTRAPGTQPLPGHWRGGAIHSTLLLRLISKTILLGSSQAEPARLVFHIFSLGSLVLFVLPCPF